MKSLVPASRLGTDVRFIRPVFVRSVATTAPEARRTTAESDEWWPWSMVMGNNCRVTGDWKGP